LPQISTGGGAPVVHGSYSVSRQAANIFSEVFSMIVNLIYQGRVSSLGAYQVQTACTELIKHDIERLHFMICSGGGDVASGIGIFNFLKSIPIEVHTINFGICGSIAATIFLAGSRRVSVPASMFSMHAATFIEGPRKGQISENTVAISSPFKTEIGWDDEKIIRFFGTAVETFVAPEAAVELRIAHVVEPFVITKEAITIGVNPEGHAPIDRALLRATTAIDRTSRSD
jgi:ATP-dependent protease ClpP protease subunit